MKTHIPYTLLAALGALAAASTAAPADTPAPSTATAPATATATASPAATTAQAEELVGRIATFYRELNSLLATDMPDADKAEAMRALKPRASELAKPMQALGARALQAAAASRELPQHPALDRVVREDEELRVKR